MAKNKLFNLILSVILVLTALFMVLLLDWHSPDELFLTAAVLIISMMLFEVVGMIFAQTVGEYFQNRRRALKAIGKGGIKIVLQDKTARTVYDGIYYFFKGDYARAEELLILALDRSDNRNNQCFCTAWLLRLYEETQNEPRMLWAMRKAVEYAPDNVDAQMRLGHAYFSDGNLSNAEYCFEKALKYDPLNSYGSYMLSKIYVMRGEDDRAVERLQSLISSGSTHPLVYAELSVIFAVKGEEDKSREYFEKAQLSGYADPEKLSKRLTAIKLFNAHPEAELSDLPQDYYRRIEKEKE